MTGVTREWLMSYKEEPQTTPIYVFRDSLLRARRGNVYWYLEWRHSLPVNELVAPL